MASTVARPLARRSGGPERNAPKRSHDRVAARRTHCSHEPRRLASRAQVAASGRKTRDRDQKREAAGRPAASRCRLWTEATWGWCRA